MKIKIFLIVGARPNFMKIAPLYDCLSKHSDHFAPVVLHTGQHYDDNMSKVFFDDLNLPRPDFFLGVGSGTHAAQTGEVMRLFERVIYEHRPEVVLVVGDVNSTIACALTAAKAKMPSETLAKTWQNYESALGNRQAPNVRDAHLRRRRAHDVPLIAHVEAGERSHDFSMPEEINRVTTDVLSDLLFTTGDDSSSNLRAEGIDPRKIFTVGNIMIDALERQRAQSEASDILTRLRADAIDVGDGGRGFALATLHRPGNVDSSDSLKTLVQALVKISEQVPVIFPVHPRTRKLLSDDPELQQTLDNGTVGVIEPLGYLDFLHLQMKSRLILTDSGGVQVESSYLGVPCLTLRPNTEWEVTVRHGTNRLVSLNVEAIMGAAREALQFHKRRPAQIPHWDGRTSERIVETLSIMLLSSPGPESR